MRCLEEVRDWMRSNDVPADAWVTDATLLRFCRARKFDAEKTITMYDNYLKFRAEK